MFAETRTESRMCVLPCRKVFEIFGGLKTAIHAARDGVPGEQVVAMKRNGTEFTGDEEYEHPLAEDIEIVYICFDILFTGEESVINRPLQVCAACHVLM